ncbi:hypothetical protein AB0C96_42780 [Streptomyces sp. NPDC048506]|uniref:hypothetical protein n=1 Tax=Streptomyces sp. NPDC048506 TaxID=3155028 RepID=UPI00342F3B24
MSVDLLHQGDQQVPHGVADLRPPGGALRREQRDPYVLGGVASGNSPGKPNEAAWH